jgi:hypothetical protein
MPGNQKRTPNMTSSDNAARRRKIATRPAFDVVHQSGKKQPWVVIMRVGLCAWEYVSHHATEASAKAKAAALNTDRC